MLRQVFDHIYVNYFVPGTDIGRAQILKIQEKAGR